MNPGDMYDDVLETRLRRALNAEASMVNPAGDGLSRIRAGIESKRYDVWWRRPAVALVAAGLLGLAVGGAAVALSNGDDPGNQVATQPSEKPQTSAPPTEAPTGSSSPAPSSSSSSSESQSQTGGAPATRIEVPVYYVHDDGRELRLYREFHTVSQHPKGRIATAVREMFGDRATDPDYSSSWPASTKVLSVSRSGDTATVDLSAFPAVGSDAETKAVQQLVYTVTAADNSVKRVRVLVDGQAPPSGSSDWSEPVARAPMVDVQGLIWILAPKQGSTVGPNVRISGYGTAFEATVSWQVLRDGQVVEEGFTQGGSMGEFAEFADSVRLSPGTYELRAFESSAEDGSPLHVDTKTFTVR